MKKLKKNKYVIFLVICLGLALLVYLADGKKNTDKIKVINHPEEHVQVVDQYSLLKYKPNFEFFYELPVYTLTNFWEPHITVRYLGFMEEITYSEAIENQNVDSKIDSPDVKVDSSDKDYIYFQAYLEVATKQKLSPKEITFWTEIRGDNQKITLCEKGSTFFSNEVEQGVQHGIMTFKLKKASDDLDMIANLLVDLYCQWNNQVYSTEGISRSQMLNERRE